MVVKLLAGRAMLGRPALWVILLSTSPVVTAAGSSTAAQDWLDKMVRAAQTLNYDGTFVYRNGNTMESMRIIHRVGADGERARLVSLSGVPREVLRDNRDVTCILPDNKSVVVSKSRTTNLTPAELFESNASFAEHYRLRNQPGERVAGRDTELVVVEPRDPYRYGFRLSLDRSTALLLKSELINEQDEPLEQIVYTSLELPSEIPDGLLQPDVNGEGFKRYDTRAYSPTGPQQGTSGLHVEWLPVGFALSDRAHNPAFATRMPVEHQVYSDGLATVSVFIEALGEGSEGLEGLSTMGAVNAFGRVLMPYQVTVVGEVPAKTVTRIGQSVISK